MLRRVFLAAATLTCLCPHGATQAEDLKLSLPADAKFVVRLDLAALRQSKIGGPLFEQAKAQALDKMADKQDGPTPEQIAEIIGFDPFEEVQSVVVAASDYEEPEQALVAVIQLRQTTGNLEGLMLALPNYSSSEYGQYMIHSARPDDDQQAHAAIYKSDDGNYALVVGAKREAVQRLLDSLDGKTPAPSPGETAKWTSLATGGPILALQVFDFPPDVIEEEGPPANIAKIVSTLALQVAEADDNVNIRMQLASHTDQQAEQLKQMAQGLVAMVNLAVASDPEDQDARLAQRLLQGVAVERSGATVDVSLALPGEEVSQLINEQIKKNN
ncbi:MAG: hypothetical protein IT424_15315 [Pirellulales bacterium]|nr:hypothetical protein [Pirellulales bacterium]